MELYVKLVYTSLRKFDMFPTSKSANEEVQWDSDGY